MILPPVAPSVPTYTRTGTAKAGAQRGPLVPCAKSKWHGHHPADEVCPDCPPPARYHGGPPPSNLAGSIVFKTLAGAPVQNSLNFGPPQVTFSVAKNTAPYVYGQYYVVPSTPGAGYRASVAPMGAFPMTQAEYEAVSWWDVSGGVILDEKGCPNGLPAWAKKV